MIETMDYIRVVNFEELQHYKNKPTYPWIKLHCKLLTNRAFMSLPAESFRLGIILWIFASETGNEIPYHSDDLAWRLHCEPAEITGWLKPLLDNNFIELYTGPRVTLEGVYSESITEERREEEIREEVTDPIGTLTNSFGEVGSQSDEFKDWCYALEVKTGSKQGWNRKYKARWEHALKHLGLKKMLSIIETLEFKNVEYLLTGPDGNSRGVLVEATDEAIREINRV